MLYDQLYALQPTDVVWMNRAIAIAELQGPQVGLDALATVDLDHYHLYHATRAELLARLGRHTEVVEVFDRAIELAANDTERNYLIHRRGGG